MNFERIAQDPQSSARCGLLYTDHGVIETPIFMPVGTVGSVKGVYHRDLGDDINAQIILGNTDNISKKMQDLYTVITMQLGENATGILDISDGKLKHNRLS